MLGVFVGFLLVLSCKDKLETIKAEVLPGQALVSVDFKNRFFDQADQVTTSDE